MLQASKQLKTSLKHVTQIVQGIELLQRQKVDLILLAHPLSDCLDLTNIEIFHQHVPQLPIVVLSAVDNLELAAQSIRLGAQDYLLEPELKPKILTRSIQLAIERQRHLFAVSQQARMKNTIERIRQFSEPKTILQTASEVIREFLRCDRVLIYGSDWLQSATTIACGTSSDNTESLQIIEQFVGAIKFPDLSTLSSRTIAVCAIEDTNESSPQLVIDPQSIRSCLLLPIRQSPKTTVDNDLWMPNTNAVLSPENEQCWGMAIAYNIRESRYWWDWEINFLQSLMIEIRLTIQQSQVCYRLQADNQRLQQLAIRDGLTKIANRRYFDLVLDKEWQRLAREQLPLSLILCDVDHFKAYNDTYGHLEGDRCLQKIARILQECSRRPADLVARYGGEEFALILPNTSAAGALFIAHKIVRLLAKQNIPHIKSKVSELVTLSLGIASKIPRPKQPSSTIIEVADSLLYQAKKAGRNQLVTDELVSSPQAGNIR